MKRVLLGFALLVSFGGTGMAASVLNTDGEARSITVAEGGSRSEITLAPGESAEFCPDGCFVTMPNGDREALTGTETVEISGGVGHVK